ncbi:hypothetical protein CRUP_020834 [Coryphaenoides rupestris]|nr:hypothetical protein CRUP_020834 [Coryphaenoides rupestris]
MVHLLPKAVKRRVHALKRLQVQCANIEAKFYEEVHELERKYATFYQPLYDKELKKKAAVEEKKEDATPEEDPKGIPEFWLTIFKGVDMLSDMLEEHDEPILKHLKDIQVKFSEPGQPMSFTLEFHFESNPFFNNAILTKVYRMKSEPESSDPFSFEGPEIIDCEGTRTRSSPSPQTSKSDTSSFDDEEEMEEGDDEVGKASCVDGILEHDDDDDGDDDDEGDVNTKKAEAQPAECKQQ